MCARRRRQLQYLTSVSLCHPLKVSRQLTNGSEISHEQRLLPVLDNVGHDLVHQENGRNTTESEDEEAENHEPSEGDTSDVWQVEFGPWDDGSDVHETTEVEDDIETAVDLVVALLGFLKVDSVPVHDVAGDEASEEIVGTERTANANGEQADSHGPEQETLGVDPLLAQRELNGEHTGGAEEGTDHNGHEDDV